MPKRTLPAVQPTATSSRSTRDRQRPRHFWIAPLVTASEDSTSAPQPNPTTHKQTGIPSTGDKATKGKVGRPPKRAADTSPAVHPPMKKRKNKPLAKRFSKPPKTVKNPVVSHGYSGGDEEEAKRAGEPSAVAVQKVENDGKSSMHHDEMDGDNSMTDIEDEAQNDEDTLQDPRVCPVKATGDSTKTTITASTAHDTSSDDASLNTTEVSEVADRLEIEPQPRPSSCAQPCSPFPTSSVPKLRCPSTLPTNVQAHNEPQTHSEPQCHTGHTASCTQPFVTLLQHENVGRITIMRLDTGHLEHADCISREALLRMLIMENEALKAMVLNKRYHEGEGVEKSLFRRCTDIFARPEWRMRNVIMGLCDMLAGR